MTAAAYKETLLTALATTLTPAGFRRRASNFVRRVTDVVQLVQLQSSQSSTAETAIVTVNLGVFSTALETARGGSIKTPTEADCHWRQRLGFLTAANQDVWWEVSNASAATRVGTELQEAIARHGLPVLDQLGSTAALVTLWQSGFGPGLTERQRRDFLAALTAVPGGHPDRVA